MRGRSATAENAEVILPFRGREAGVPVIICFGAGCYGDGIGCQMVIQSLRQTERVPVLQQITMSDLT